MVAEKKITSARNPFVLLHHCDAQIPIEMFSAPNTSSITPIIFMMVFMVLPERFELPIIGLEFRCAVHLRYGRLVPPVRLELTCARGLGVPDLLELGGKTRGEAFSLS